VHYARVVQELYGLNVLMMVESSFVLLCKPLNFARHNIHLQVSVEVIVSIVPGCIDHVPEYFVLESLYNVYITLFGATPELNTVCPNGFYDLFVYDEFVMEGQRGVPSYQPIHFLYLRSSSSRFFLTWAFHRSLESKVMPRYLAVWIT